MTHFTVFENITERERGGRERERKREREQRERERRGEGKRERKRERESRVGANQEAELLAAGEAHATLSSPAPGLKMKS